MLKICSKIRNSRKSIAKLLKSIEFICFINEFASWRAVRVIKKQTPGNFDLGATLGSYLGLLFLSGCYTAIGIFSSSLTKNQIVAFIIAVFICFLSFFLFEGISGLSILEAPEYGIEYFGISYHYRSISRGVVDTRDLIYFLSFIALFLKLTHFRIKNLRNN